MNNLILLGEYGSVAQGTATANSDHDYMGIVVETKEQVIGLGKYNTKRVSDAANGEKSKPGESDTTYHSLRKFASLAAAGNPTLGSILYLPEYQTLTEVGKQLVEARPLFWSRRGVRAYRGYLHSQIVGLQGGRGEKRPDLIADYGYDVKFAYHAYRLGVQGVQYADTGDPGIPLRGAELSYAKRIKAGRVSYVEVMAVLESVDKELEFASKFDIPDEPDYDGINKLLISIHEDVWQHGIF